MSSPRNCFGSRWSLLHHSQRQEREMSKPQESALQKSHPALQFGKRASFEEIRTGISTSHCWIGTKKRASATFGSDGPPSSFKAFQEPCGGPAGVWGMGRDRKEARVPLSACAGAELMQTRVQGRGQDTTCGAEPSPRASHTACLQCDGKPAPTCSLSPHVRLNCCKSKDSLWYFLKHPLSFSVHWLIDSLIT